MADKRESEIHGQCFHIRGMMSDFYVDAKITAGQVIHLQAIADYYAGPEILFDTEGNMGVHIHRGDIEGDTLMLIAPSGHVVGDYGWSEADGAEPTTLSEFMSTYRPMPPHDPWDAFTA